LDNFILFSEPDRGLATESGGAGPLCRELFMTFDDFPSCFILLVGGYLVVMAENDAVQAVSSITAVHKKSKGNRNARGVSLRRL
jgi:hypothetical protein